jgi:hypothetical protein
MNQNEIYQLISSITGQKNILTIPREFINYTGDITSALLLNQLLYWTPKSNDGWIYKTYQDWESEIGFSEYKIRKASESLKNLELLETKIKKANGNPTVHYRLNTDKFLKGFLNFLNQRNLSIDTEKSLQTNITETTTETTTKGNDKIIPGLQSEETQAHKIIDYWNDKKLNSHHKYSQSLIKNIKITLGHYASSGLFEAIDNYSIIYHDNKYAVPMKMTLHNFIWFALKTEFKAKAGFIQFLSINKPLEKFIKFKDDFELLRSEFTPVTIEYDPSVLLDKENNTYYGFNTDELRDKTSVDIEIAEIKDRGVNDYFQLNYNEFVISALFFTRKYTPQLDLLKEMMIIWKKNKDKYEKII